MVFMNLERGGILDDKNVFCDVDVIFICEFL